MALTTRQFRLLRTGAIVATCFGVGWAITQPDAPASVAAAGVAPVASAPRTSAPRTPAPKASAPRTPAPKASQPKAPQPKAPAPKASAPVKREKNTKREKITGTDPVTVSFAGDTNFEDQLRKVAADPAGLAALKPYLSAADVSVVNLETAVTTRGAPLAGKQFTFRAPPSALTTLANAGVDIVGMANNHAVDYGRDGLADSLAARAGSPVRLVGIGANAAEAFAPVVSTVDGVSVAIINASQLREQTTVYHAAGDDKPGIASTVTPERLVAAVRHASARYDVVMVFLHWGVEKEFCPSAKQFAATKYLKAAGADAVVGGHAHRVQGAGWDGSTYVAYGLGNFIWYRSDTFPGRSTGVLTLSIDKKRVAARRALPVERRREPGAMVTAEKWVPLENNTSGVPAAVDADTAARMMADRAGRQQCAKLSDAP